MSKSKRTDFKVGDWVKLVPGMREYNIETWGVDFGPNARRVTKLGSGLYTGGIFVSGLRLWFSFSELVRDEFLTAASESLGSDS